MMLYGLCVLMACVGVYLISAGLTNGFHEAEFFIGIALLVIAIFGIQWLCGCSDSNGTCCLFGSEYMMLDMMLDH